MEANIDRLPPSSSSSFKPTFHHNDVSIELDLYTIPSHSFWFSWDSIHDTERIELREFFDGSSFTRTPKIYKEYRDFIISKYREDPSRRLTFTEVRKSLVGDVHILSKVFNFLDKWGLINFSAPPLSSSSVEQKLDEGVKVRVEEGAPIGVRVVGNPNTLKPLKAPPSAVDADGGGGGVDNGFKLPPLASYSVVFGGLEAEKGMFCGNCKEKCESKYYECTKEKSVICFKCVDKGVYGENRSMDDFKLNDNIESIVNQGGVWTEAETLLLLESVLKHRDDWDLVAQNVQTKTKIECISRLIELPFGELMLGSHGKLSAKTLDGNAGQEQKASSVSQEKGMLEIDHHQENHHVENNLNKENNDHHVESNNLHKENDHHVENIVHKENDDQHVENNFQKENDDHVENNVQKENDDHHVENNLQKENDDHHVENNLQKENDDHHVENNLQKENDDHHVENNLHKENDDHHVENNLHKENDDHHVENNLHKNDDHHMENNLHKEDEDHHVENNLHKENEDHHVENNRHKENDDHHVENNFHKENGDHHVENNLNQENDDHNVENNVHKDNIHHQDIADRKNTEMGDLEPPSKKSRVDSSDPSRSLMEQVALISTMVVPPVTAAAANAAVSVLCDGNPLLREVFYSDDHMSVDGQKSGNLDMEMERAFQSEDTEMKDTFPTSEIDNLSQKEASIPLALRMRAAVATALGAAAAHSKLLADQEEREIEHLMTFIIETQVKKLERKMKFFEELEHMMEKEHAFLEESKDEIIGQRVATLRSIFDAGLSRPRDPNP